MPQNWYTLQVKPHKERTVYEQLLIQNVPVFYPSVRVHPTNPRASKIRPYFPGYMFVRANLDELGRNAFSWTPGTKGLVNFGGQPAIVPATFIQALQKRITAIEADGGLVFNNLKPGDRVYIHSGPFAGYEAIFDLRLPGKDRVQVLLAFLSQFPQPVQLNVSAIKKVRRRS